MTDSEKKSLMAIYEVMASGKIHEARLMLEKFLGIVAEVD